MLVVGFPTLPGSSSIYLSVDHSMGSFSQSEKRMVMMMFIVIIIDHHHHCPTLSVKLRIVIMNDWRSWRIPSTSCSTCFFSISISSRPFSATSLACRSPSNFPSILCNSPWILSTLCWSWSHCCLDWSLIDRYNSIRELHSSMTVCWRCSAERKDSWVIARDVLSWSRSWRTSVSWTEIEEEEDCWEEREDCNVVIWFYEWWWMMMMNDDDEW